MVIFEIGVDIERTPIWEMSAAVVDVMRPNWR
jgi:hypothetical protein